jgi:type IV secretory pathway VirB10-like protein
MGSNRLAFAALGLGCVVAAGGGSYLATRHNIAEAPVAASSATVAPAPASAALQPPIEAPATPATANATPAVTPMPAPTVPERPQAVARAIQPPVRVAAPVARPSTQTRQSELSAAHTDTQTPVVDHNAPSQTPVLPSDPAPVVRVEDHPVELPRPVEPPQPTFDELVVSADSVIGLQTETYLSSERARVEDRVEARIVRDVRVGGRVAIPAGTRVSGSVVAVDRGGRMRDRARLGIRFNTILMADGTRMPITTETIYRYGDAPGNDSAKKIGGGAVAGAILGAIIGGGKGAAIGATAGAAGGGAATMAGARNEAEFQAGAEITARILAPIAVTVEH